MSHLQLTTEEEEALHDLLTTRLTELEVEILHTDHSAFRDLLKHRRLLLARIAERLVRPNEVAPSV
jgi:hypothetical protein